MTHKDKSSYAQKHSGVKLNPTIAEAVKKATSEDKLSCAAAFNVAGKLKITPAEVGITIDLLEIPIIKCQLGLFGYGPSKKGLTAAETVSSELESVIRKSLVMGKLPCASAWEIATKFKVARKEVSAACEALKIRISSCQLGTF